jgi:hypothetical protein
MSFGVKVVSGGRQDDVTVSVISAVNFDVDYDESIKSLVKYKHSNVKLSGMSINFSSKYSNAFFTGNGKNKVEAVVKENLINFANDNLD